MLLGTVSTFLELKCVIMIKSHSDLSPGDSEPSYVHHNKQRQSDNLNRRGRLHPARISCDVSEAWEQL